MTTLGRDMSERCPREAICVETLLSGRMVEFRYELRLADSGRVIATGYTKHIWTGRDMRPARLPEKYYETFRID